ncbi:MAG: hypothetical protein ACFB4I_05925 [Cyanophyceae cyanobacterium]
MSRLTPKAWKILTDEVAQCTANSTIATEVQRDILLRRLQKLQVQPGAPLNEAELRHIVSDIFPNFDRKVLKAAAKANRPPSPLQKVPVVIACFAGVVGLGWAVNLPYPMIRRPVARVAPILLLPSYISMDRHYREALAHVEQADQLVNYATSAADFELGAEKVAAAKQNLEALPVWFLGYEPQAYCQWFSCHWRFTLDEFKQARTGIARMEAKIFQEQNAMAQLEQTEANLLAAKQLFYRSDAAQKQRAIAQWQAAIDQLAQLPPSTLAAQLAQAKVASHQREIQNAL